MVLRKGNFLAMAFTLSINLLQAQGFDLGSWNILNVKYKFDGQWSLFGEAQLRSLQFYNQFHYHEFKGGFTYKFANLQLTLGAGKYDTYKEGGNFILPKNNTEARLWPQLVLTQNIWKLKIEQRYRAEFRFAKNNYRNRFRYRLGLSYPFGKEKNGYKPYQVNTSNEIFFTDKEPYFERDRMLLGFNHQTSPALTIQVGYLHQFDYKINDETGRDFLQLGLYLDLPGKKEKYPGNYVEMKD